MPRLRRFMESLFSLQHEPSEAAQIVAWLKAEANRFSEEFYDGAASILYGAAEAIEAGAHRKTHPPRRVVRIELDPALLRRPGEIWTERLADLDVQIVIGGRT